MYDSFAAWLNKFLACFGSCLGTCRKSTHASASNKQTKGPYTVEKPVISEDFWTTSTYDIDNSAAQSQRSMSSISASNQGSFCDSGCGTINHEFVNHGLLLWNQIRVQWTGGAGHRTRSTATYDSLLANSQSFRHPIPLSEMVNFLVDVWEHEGLYD
ncbi:hypothetical protein AKJ16_DCAP21465 [Drosera capensis]